MLYMDSNQIRQIAGVLLYRWSYKEMQVLTAYGVFGCVCHCNRTRATTVWTRCIHKYANILDNIVHQILLRF